MESTGPISFSTAQATRAYGVAKRPMAREVTPAQPSAAQRLVAGTVQVPADPDQAPLPSSGGFAMYTRAADRIEAAIRVTLGQRIDARA